MSKIIKNMKHYTFSEVNAEFNEFFARYGSEPTEQDLQEYLEDMSHLNTELQRSLELSLRQFIN